MKGLRGSGPWRFCAFGALFRGHRFQGVRAQVVRVRSMGPSEASRILPATTTCSKLQLSRTWLQKLRRVTTTSVKPVPNLHKSRQ